MPRGTRAYHETGWHVSHTGEQGGLVGFMPDAQWLPAVCWCEGCLVAVRTSEIGLRTYSCGLPDCAGPEGVDDDEPVLGIVLKNSVSCRAFDAESFPPEAIARWANRKRKKAHVVAKRRLREKEEAQMRGVRVSRFDVEMRRQDVEQLWREGKNAMDIAIALEVPFTTARQDLQVLQQRQRITKRRGMYSTVASR